MCVGRLRKAAGWGQVCHFVIETSVCTWVTIISEKQMARLLVGMCKYLSCSSLALSIG